MNYSMLCFVFPGVGPVCGNVGPAVRVLEERAGDGAEQHARPFHPARHRHNRVRPQVRRAHSFCAMK